MSIDKTSDEVEKRLLLVSGALEAAAASLQIIVSEMQDALKGARDPVTHKTKAEEQKPKE